MKQKQFIFASMVMLLSFVSLVFAQTNNNVAKVGATEYATIDEAIANWTNGTTLTLLANVQLSDVITLKSTEHHILNLGTYTMTAASGKHAIEITCEGRSSASYALTVNADASNPGGITATGKSCIYYNKSGSTKDRPIILINNGVFTGTCSLNLTSNGNTNCPQIWINGGVFNNYMNLTKCMLKVSGGTFHAAINCTGDSSAYREIKGGRFKSWQFMTADAATKFWVGSGNGNYNVGVYVDTEGYLVVGGPVITEVSAKYPAVASNYSKWSSYLKYSAAATYGLFYEDAAMAIAKHGAANVTVYEHVEVVEELDNNAAVKDFTPELPSEVVTFEVEAIDIEATAEATTKVTFNVEPKNASGQKVSNPSAEITFRLPVPAAWSGKANVYHEGTLLGAYTIKGENDAKYVEVSSANFSEFAVEAIVPTEVEVATLAELQAALADNSNELPIIITETIVIPEGETVVLDLNGKTVTVPETTGKHIYALNNKGSLTLKDTKGNGSITARGIYNGYNGTSTDETVAGAKMTIESGKYIGMDTDGGAAIFNCAELVVKDGDFTGGVAAINNRKMGVATIMAGNYHGGNNYVIQNNGGLLTIDDATVDSGFGAVGNYSGTTVINDGTYLPTGRANATCHVVYVAGAANVTINGGTFKMNYPEGSTPDSGSAVASYYNGTVVINGGSFTSHFDNVSPVELSNGATIKGGTYLTHSGNASNHTYIKNYLAENLELSETGTVVAKPVAEVNGVKYASFAEAAAAAQAGNEIKLLANIEGDITVPANVTLNGNDFAISGGILAEGDITFAGVTTAADFDANVVNTAVNIPAGASLQLIGTARLVIGHGATFNITGTIEDAKTADKATLVPSLKIAAGASITGNGVTFNVNNAYIVANANTTSKNSNANGTLDFNINNSIWEQTGVLAFYVPTSGKDPVVNFELKNSVLTTTSHLVFSVTKGEIVIDNSLVNQGASRQIENRSTMTIKNGSVVNGAVATSSNAINPGTIIVENATYAVTGEFSGAAEGTGTLVIKKGANVSVGSIKAGANVTVDAEGMAAGDEINFTANLSQFTGTLSVINNDKLEASIVDGKVVLAAKPVAKIGETPYATLEEAFAAATEGQTITLLDDATPALTSQRAITKAAVIDLGGKTMTLKEDDLYFGTTTFKNGTIVVDPSVKPSTAVFWMFANQTLTFDNVKVVATGVTGTYLIGLEGENSDLNLLNGSEILVENTTALDLDIICVNGTNTCDIKVENSKVNVTNLDGRVFFRGNYTVKDSEVNLAGITKAGFRIEAGQTLSIEGTSEVNIEGEPRDGGIHLTDASANYTKAETATVNATVNEPKVAKIGETTYKTLQAAIEAVQEGETIILIDNVVLAERVTIPADKTLTIDLNGKSISMEESIIATAYAINNLGNLTITDGVGGGSINARGIYNGYGDGAANVATAKITVVNGTINAKGANGGAAVYNYGIAEIKGGTFTSIGGYSLNSQSGASMTIADGVTANNGIYVSGATLVVDGGEISGNRSGCHVLYAWNSTVTINGGEFYNNNSGNSTTMAAGTTELTINGGTFGIKDGRVPGNGNTWTSCLTDTQNSATMTVNGGTFNGGFRVQGGTTMTIAGGEFNDCYGSGYNIYGTAEVKGGTFTDAAAQKFATENLSAGYELGANGTVAAKPVAQIGETTYTSIEDAIAAAQAGDEIKLLANVTVEGTLALPAGIKLTSNGHTITGSIRMLGDLELNGPLTITGGLWVGKSGETLTATLSGGKLTANYFMFQHGTYTIDADIDAVYGYLSFNGTFEVNSTIHTTGANGEVLYINGNVNLNDGAVLDSDNSVFVNNNNAVLTLKPGSKVDSNVNITASGAKLNIDATGMAAGASANITGTVTNSANGTIAVVGNDNLEASIVNGKIVLAAKVAMIGETPYTTLQAAIEAVQDGQTIVLIADITVEEANATNGNAVYYTGDKSFTIDLNDKTVTGNTSNVVFRFQKAEGGAENTITIQNGKVVAKENTWSAISVGSNADTKTNIILTGLEIEACKRNDFAVRARSGAIFTITDCTITANAYGGGVAAGGGEVTMTDVTINQYGLDASAPWNSAAFGISSGGKMTINSGSYYATPKAAADGNNQGTSHGSFVGIIMNSGGTLIINGGTFTNDNFGDNALATAARGLIEADAGAVVEINGGIFNGLKSILAMTNNLGDTNKNPSATIKGGTFSADPRVSGLYASNLIKIAEGYVVTEKDGVYTVVKAAAKIGEQGYASLQAAFNAVQDGETITLVDNVTISAATAGYTDGTYTDGVRYTGDKSFTVDFNGKTVTDDGCVNDYLIYINNKGEKASEITFTNGTIVSANGCWSAVCVNSSAATQNVELNLNGMNITNSNDAVYSGNPVVRVRTLATVNVNDGTIITSNGASYGVAANTDGSTVNINEGATIVQQNSGTTGGNSVFAAVGGKGVINIKGGTITSDRYGVHTMTTGTPVINISGGTITAPVALKSSTNGGNGELATINVTGGTINGTLETYTDNGKIVVSGGTFSEAVAEEYCADGFVPAENADGTFGVEKAPVASINGTKYTSLAEAVAAAQAGDEIVLTADVKTTDGVVITDKNLTIDLNGKTYTVTEGANTNNRNFKINGTSVVTVKNGTMVAAGEYSSGAYGTIRTEGTANVTLTGLKLYNYRGNGLNIKAYAGTTVTIENTEIYANYGGGIEAAGGTIVVNDGVTVEQKGMYTAPYNSMAISVNGGGKVTVNGGTFSTECITAEEANNQGTSHGPWVAGVLNSGGTLIINGGTFSNDNFGENSLATAARGAILADTKAKVEINGGTFNVLKNVIDIQNNLGDANNNPSVLLVGGTYSADPRISAQYGSNLITLAEGYMAVENNGVWTVVKAAAKIGAKYYASLAEAFTAAQDGETITVLHDIEETETAINTKNVTLDLNGKTVTMVYTAKATKNHTMVSNSGNLTIESSVEGGKLSYTYAGEDLGVSYSTNTVTSNPGSVLTVKSGTIENLTYDKSVIAYAIDGLTNGGAGDVTVNIEGGVITSKRQAVRIFANSTTNTGALNISGGDITGRVIVQNANANANKAVLNITAGTFNANEYKSDVLYVGGSSSATIDINATVRGGTFNGEITETNVAGFIIGGTYKTDVNQFCALGYQAQANAAGLYAVEYTGKVAEFTIVDGEYTEFNIEEDVEVGTLTYERNFSAANRWNALYVPFEIPVELLTQAGYEVAYVNDVHSYDNLKADGTPGEDGVIDDMKMEVILIKNGKLNANYPYLIRANSAGLLSLEIENAKLYTTEEKSVSCSSVFMKFEVTGIYESKTAGELGDANSIYALGGGVWTLPESSNQQLKPFRLYLKATKIDGSPVVVDESTLANIRIRVAGEKDEATGIITPIIEGDVHVNDGTVYDLMGRPVRTPEKGKIYIMNGKKVLF